MIKLLFKLVLGAIVVLALIGSAIQFESTDKSWALIVDKEKAKISVQTGFKKVYDFSEKLITDFGKDEGDKILSKESVKS
ncbi:hypothetical protein SPONN_2819 [uncultured Candidatus Thioglobus sp.]|nr:hypothetical protein SPONN_2819 [uncultured Candidatus Thioglobus sp.]SMM99444.1 hypothetical protein SPONL_601 [uncultured Candidatus Thioglobus sp.]